MIERIVIFAIAALFVSALIVIGWTGHQTCKDRSHEERIELCR